jgi:cytochrome d ubiquinol oxidase subunit II
MPLFTLANWCALAVIVSLTAYVVLGGADFGGGVWDLLASGPRKREQRELIAHAIGPIWEANHVWLILVVVLLFTCFPPVFATLSIHLHIPLALMLVGIVLRGSAFTFRAYGVQQEGAIRAWGRVFAIASVITPLLLGACVGAIASGALDVPLGAGVHATYVAPWLAPFPIACGVLALAAFTFLAAVYLTMDAPEGALREDFRTRALWAALAVFVTAFGALLVSHASAPRIREALTGSAWAAPFHVATGLAALLAIWALWTRRWRVARIAAPAQVSLILWGWAASQYPALIPGQLTIADAAAPEITLRITLWALAAGAAVLFPSLWYLFRLFKSAPEAA